MYWVRGRFYRKKFDKSSVLHMKAKAETSDTAQLQKRIFQVWTTTQFHFIYILFLDILGYIFRKRLNETEGPFYYSNSYVNTLNKIEANPVAIYL